MSLPPDLWNPHPAAWAKGESAYVDVDALKQHLLNPSFSVVESTAFQSHSFPVLLFESQGVHPPFSDLDTPVPQDPSL